MRLFGSFRRWLTEDLFVSQAYLNTRIDHVARAIDDASDTFEQQIPRFLNAVATVPALANKQIGLNNEIAALRERTDRSTDEIRSSIARAEQNAADISKRLDSIRSEILQELRNSGVEIKASPSVQGRVIDQAKLEAVPLRINLGGGRTTLASFVNVDMRELPGVDVVAPMDALPFAQRSVDEIFSAHVLERFPQEQLKRLLPYWKNVLKPGGKFRAVMVDGRAMLQSWAAGNISFDDYRTLLFGSQKDERDFHCNVFEPESFVRLLADHGFRDVRIIEAARRNGLSYEFEVEAIA